MADGDDSYADISFKREDTTDVVNLSGPPIQFIVGAECRKRVFYMNENQFRGLKKYYESVSQPGHPVRLEDNDPAVFEVYLNWRYFGTLPVVGGDSDYAVEDDGRYALPINLRVDYHALVNVFLLAHKLGDYEAQDMALDAIEDTNTDNIHGDYFKFPAPKTVCLVYGDENSTDLLRETILECFLRKGGHEFLERNISLTPHEFQLHLTKKLMAKYAYSGEKKRKRSEESGKK
ncbi:hypothetical protein K4F52_010280 [Lecanicillium sp. MT-2017a]|nr:hypothetical protein K4F52_010280 [Lecanicillium sp. MT-2017a]